MDLLELRTEASVCTACELNLGRNLPVFDKGNHESKIMICGMVPADDENKAGIPFVGKAGKLLDKILEDCHKTLDNVYITNLVKCYLKAGLPLQQDWIDACLPYLLIQISIVKPKVIITLGKDSSVTLIGMESKSALGKIRGKVFEYGPGIKVIPTYHPSYLLRAGGAKHKNYRDVVEDFLLAEKIALDN